MLPIVDRIEKFLRTILSEEDLDKAASLLVRSLIFVGPLLVLLLGAGWIGYGLAQQNEESPAPQQPTPVEVTVKESPNQALRIAPEEPLPAGTSREAPSPAIPGLSVMDVRGHLNGVPSGRSFRCPGASSDRGSLVWRCSSEPGEGEEGTYEVSIVGDDPGTIRSVTATASEAPASETTEFLAHVAGLALRGTGAADSEAWIEENLDSGGRVDAGGAELSMYGTGQARTVAIVATDVPAENRRTEASSPKIEQEITDSLTKQVENKVGSGEKSRVSPREDRPTPDD